VPLSETKEEEGSLGAEDKVIKQVDIGSKNAGSIAGDILDTDADLFLFLGFNMYINIIIKCVLRCF
jgi:hypothetical protein